MTQPNNYPTVINGQPVDADVWFNAVARDLTAVDNALAVSPPVWRARQTVTAPVANVNFTNVPSLRYLRVIWRAFSTNASGLMNLYMSINADSSSAYSYFYYRQDGAANVTEQQFAVALCVAGMMTGTSALPHDAHGVITFPAWDGAGGAAAQDHGFTSDSVAFTTGTTANWSTRQGGGYYSAAATLTQITFTPQFGNFAGGTDFCIEGSVT